MPDSYLWGAGNIVNPALLAATIKFNNSSPGDKSTAEKVTNAPPAAAVSNELTGMIDFGDTVTVAECQVAYGSTGYTGNDGSHGTTVVVERFDGAWHTFGTHTNFDISDDGTGFNSYITTVFPCNASASRIRAYVVGAFHQAGPITVTTGISDFRATTVLPPQAAGTFDFLGMAAYGLVANGVFDFVGSAQYAQAIPAAPILTVVTDCQNDCDTATWTVGAVYPPVLESILYLDYVAPQNEIYRGPLMAKVRRRDLRQEKRMYCVAVRNALGTSAPGFAQSDHCDPLPIHRKNDGWTTQRRS